MKSISWMPNVFTNLGIHIPKSAVDNHPFPLTSRIPEISIGIAVEAADSKNVFIVYSEI